MYKKSCSMRRYTSAILMVLLFFSSMVVATAYTIEDSADNEEIVSEIADESSDGVDGTLDMIEEPAFTDDVNAIDDEEDMITQEIEEDILKLEQETVEEIESAFTENDSITPFSNVSSFQELQDAIENAPTNGEETVIRIASRLIEFEDTISIENGMNITIQTDPAIIQENNYDNLSILQKQSNGRHFSVTSGSTLTLENIVLQGNRDESNIEERDAIGGGIVVAGEGANLVMDGRATNILLCYAEEGGAVKLEDGAAFTMKNGIISQNRAASKGGGIFLGENTTFTMENGLISGNKAIPPRWDSPAANGGGLYLAEDSNFIMENGEIITNTANNYGGGVYITSLSYANINGEIIGNAAFLGSGGGIYTEGYNILFTSDSTIFDNNHSPGASPFLGRASDFPNIGFARVSQSFEGYEDHPINNRDINNDLDFEINDDETIEHNVTVNYVGLDGEEIIGLDGEQVEPVIHSVIHASELNIEEKLTTIDGFMALHYVIEGDDEQHDLTTTLEITEDMTINVYHVSTIMTIIIPEQTEFYANETTGGAVVSETYDIINESELPVKVVFKELTPIYMDGINLVSEATNENDLHFNIDFSVGTNNGINNITPNHEYNEELGVLGGTFIGDSDSKGRFSISGQYIGNITANPKKPLVEFMFSFELDKEAQ